MSVQLCSLFGFPQNISTHSHVFLRILKSAPLPLDMLFRQHSPHCGTQEHFYPQGSDPVPPACGGDRQRLPSPLQHQHLDHQCMQLSSSRPLSHRRGRGPRSVYGGQPANLVRATGVPGYTDRCASMVFPCITITS